MSFPSVHSDQQSTAFATIVSVSDFPVTYHGYYSFLYFLRGFLFCWCEGNTGRHFKGFYFTKNKRHAKQ